MAKLPSALELEILSDSELADRLSEALQALKEYGTISDNSDEQSLYRLLQTEQTRRRLISDTSETNNLDTDDMSI